MLHLSLTLFLLHCSVTLYAEFLPSKQRAKCVVLLDVSVSFLCLAGGAGLNALVF